MCGVAYGNSKYVTAGSYSPNPGLIYISDDGNNWTKVIDSDIPATSTFKGVAYGNGIFVLVGDDGLILSSTDGLDWTQRTSGVTANFNKLIFVESKFYAVGASRTLVSSSDGINWSQVSFNVGSASDDLGSITFGNSLFVIGTRGSNGGSNVYKSSTATSGSWTSQTVSASLSINRIQYLKDRFYIFTASSDIFTSANGSSWANSTSSMVATMPNSTTQTLASPNQIFHGIYDGTKLYLFGSSQYHGGYGSVFSSSDGTNFTLHNRTTTIVAQHSDYVNGKYFQTGNEGLCVSTDGVNYTYPGGSYTGITTDGTNTVVVGSTGSSEAVMISFTDLNTISNNTSAIYSPLQSVGYLNNRFIAVGNGGTILSSTDGTTWTKQTSADSDPLRAVAYGNGKYVAVGAQGKIINSTNGTSWTSVQKDGASGSNFYSVRYLNGYFIAVGGGAANTGAARIAYSTDGQTWTEIDPGITGHFHDIAYNGSKYLLVGRLNSATISSREFFSTTTTDITSNTFTSNVTVPTTNTGGQELGASGVGSIAYSNGHFVAVTNQIETPFDPYILESSDGTSWTPYLVSATSRLRSVTASGNNFYIAGTSSALVKFSYASTNTTATVTTGSASSISTNSATLGGNVTADGGTTVTERGIVWSTSTNPTTANNKVAIGSGTGTFSQTITGLPSNTTIYVKAYAINTTGTAYGNEISLTTLAPSTLLFIATNDGINGFSEFYGYNPTKGSAQKALDINAFGNDNISGKGYVWNNKLFGSFQNSNGTAQFGYYDGSNFVAIGNLDPYVNPSINEYAEYNGDLYFEAGDNSYYHLWRYDPDTNTLTKISASLGRTRGYGLAVYHAKLYFSATTSTDLNALTTLYTWDGSTVSTVSNFSNVASNPYRFFVFNDYIYMAASPSGQALNTELYRYTDAGSGSTSLVADLNTTGNNNSSSTISDFTLFDGKLFFTTAANYLEGRVYSINTSNSLTIEYDPPLINNSNQPSNLVVLNNILYFKSPYSTTKMEIMRYNSTNNVTVLTNHTATNKTIFSLAAYENNLYFVRSESNSDDKEIFKYDIGTQTVTQITDINTTGNGSSIDSYMYVLPVETAPAVYGGANVLMHQVGSGSSTINSAIKISDIDVSIISGGAVTIGNGFMNGDQLNFTNQNGISGTYNSLTGVLTLTGNATISTYETALSTITFSTSSTTIGDRIIIFQVSDGSKNSSATAKASQTSVRVYNGSLFAFNFDSAPSGVPVLSSSPSSYANAFNLTDASLGTINFKVTDDSLTTSFASLTPTSGTDHGLVWNDAQYGGINSLSIVSNYTSPKYLAFKTASGKKINFESFTYWDDGSFYGGGPYFGNIYVVGYKDGVQVAYAKLPVHLNSPKPILLNADFRDLDEVRLRVYDPADPYFLYTPVFGVFDNLVFTEATTVLPPTISSASYDASGGILYVTGTNLVNMIGPDNDVVVSKLTLTGEGNSTYTLTSDDVEITSTTSFEITLNSTDKAAVNLILNKNGAVSTNGTTYNLAAADDWLAATSGSADLTSNAVTVSNVSLPTITSASYDATTGVLVVSGTGFLVADGLNNDINVSKLKIRGEGNSTYTLTSASVDLTNGTTFTVILNNTDITGLSVILNKAGTASADNTTYNLEATDDWNAGANAAIDISDILNNSITVSNIPASLATVITASATAISPSSATLGGNVTIDGGTAVTERGIVWSTSTNPTTGDNKVNIGTGTGTFSQNITGLPEGTVIYVRGYAINSVGTAYGNEISFSTCPAAPIITPPGSLVICSPSTLTLTASGCAGTVKWSDNSTGTSITLSGVGTYSLSAVCIINGCMSNASSTVTGLEIKSNTVPSISINPLLICAGTNQTLTALPVNEGLNPKYFWYKNNIVQYISAFVNKTTSQGLVGNTVYDVFFDNNGKIYVATSVGLSISSDGGNTFSNKTTANGLGNNTVRGVHVTSDGKIYVATLGGLSISNDGGNTFTNKTTASGLGDNNVYEIFVATNGKIYAATNGGLSISTDGGTSFINKNTTNGLGSNTVYAIAIGADNKIYLATSGGGVGISSDAGNTFTNKTTINGLGHNTVRSIYLAPDNKLYAATSGGLSISTDGGNTFNNKNTSNGLTVNSVLGVTSGADGRIYVATQGGGIGISSDGGNSFTNKTIADGLGNNNVWGVYISPDNKLYSATLGGGLSIASIINGNSYAANGISTSDTYKVVLFPSAEMCSNPASVQASISASSTPAPTVSAPANLSVYWPDTLTLTASGCAGTITWSNNTTGTSVTLSAVGTYTLSATCTANGCTSSASTAITGLEIKQSLTPIIGTPVLSASSICAGSNLTITFEVSGPFGAGNQFSVLLSDTTGSFTNPTTIGTSSSSGTITYNVPIAIKGSTAYKIKIVSSNPVVESPEVSLKVHANNKIISATENLTGNNTIKAVNSIQAGNKFITPTNTLFKAGNSILLTAGFETNGVFVAEIGSCSE
ncbi:hypothetical protein GCM10027442_15000 [Emticicia fontis]